MTATIATTGLGASIAMSIVQLVMSSSADRSSSA